MTPNLTSRRFMLRAFQKADLAIFAAYRNRPEVARYQSWSHYSEEDAERLYHHMDYALFGTPGKWFQLAIAEKYENILWGDLALHFVDEQQVEIGFTVAPEYQQKGVATEAVQTLLRHLFEHRKTHRVRARTDTRNTACCGLLEKIGFRREAHHRENIFFKGQWGDEYVYALLRSEWT